MTFRADLEAYLRNEANPTYKFSHQPRLYALTQHIAALTTPTPTYDDDIVYAAAYLHDLGVFIGHRPENPASLATWDHIAYACDRTPAILTSIRFPAEKIPAVLACIREHLPTATPHTFEATLLRDADIVEQLGTIGILRTAAKLGSDTRFHRLSDVRSYLRHTLQTLPPRIHLEATRTLAAPRIAAIEAFLTALDIEAGNHLD